MIHGVYTFLQSQKCSTVQVGIMNLYLTDASRTELQRVSIKSVNDPTTRREIHLRNKLIFNGKGFTLIAI